MDKAKAAVSNFLSKDGKHETTVHETVNPAVQNEHITRTKHEEAQKVIDREVHQDHYHTSVQPIKDREVLPEQHSHNLVGTEHREVNHGNDEHVRQRLEAERAQFKSTKEIGETQHTSAAAPTLSGEHVHHHVHETIQPVIQKETIQPSVVHTTIPVHEVHHNEAKHHTASALPAVTLAEFEKQGGSLGGREERTDAFAGEPRSVGETLSGNNRDATIGGPGARGTTSVTDRDGATGRSGTTRDTTTGTGHSGTHGTTGTTGTRGTTGTSGTTGTTGTTGSGYGNSTTDNTSTTGTKKASLIDKINPMVDSNGDGKAGFMK